MPWKLINGQPVRVEVSPQEVTVTKEFDGLEVEVTDGVLSCPECGKEYKTEQGLENHLDDKH